MRLIGGKTARTRILGVLTHDPREIARKRRIGYATVRTHLRSAFAKTGTRRQAELVALVLRCARLG